MKIKSPAINAPASRQEAEQMIAQIGYLQRQHGDVERRMNDELEQVKAKHMPDANALNEQITLLVWGVKAWAETNKDSLLKPRSKTVKLSSGEISWRTSPPKVSLSGKPAIIERLKNLGLTRFLRTAEDINKDAILADPEAVEGVKGISIKQDELFALKPNETQIERVETIAKQPLK